MLRCRPLSNKPLTTSNGRGIGAICGRASLCNSPEGYEHLTSVPLALGTIGPVTVDAINSYNIANGVKVLKQGPSIVGSKVKPEVLAHLAACILAAEGDDQVKHSFRNLLISGGDCVNFAAYRRSHKSCNRCAVCAEPKVTGVTKDSNFASRPIDWARTTHFVVASFQGLRDVVYLRVKSYVQGACHCTPCVTASHRKHLKY